LLAEGVAHGKCRFWLLDLRERQWPSPAFTAWLTELFAYDAVAQLGSPVFIGYVAHEEHRRFVESLATVAALRRAAESEFYPRYFDNEASALDWLHYYQTQPDLRPPYYNGWRKEHR